ncbi:unnamed protein product [Closterium sp. Naga37s-1]|nr:unnamed protein product [Closterium sp. Naga37s-1]
MAEMEDIWKEAFPVGTEWDQYDKVYEIEWDFSNLDEAFDEGGPLHDKRVYLFGCTEPQLVHWKGKDKVVHVPAVVAVLSPFAPSDKLGIKSVQMETEMIVPMREMKMDWIPFIPDTTGRGSDLRRHRSNIFTLKCIQRRAGLRQMKHERVKKFEYCLPYIFLPHMQEEQEVDTVVSIMYPFEGDNPPPPLLAEYDWEMDEYEEFTDNLVKDESLPEAEKAKFIEYVKKEVKEAKLKAKKEREERKKAIEDMGEERLEALKNLRFLKFYPKQSDDTPDISEFKAHYINRYYGKAHELIRASLACVSVLAAFVAVLVAFAYADHDDPELTNTFTAKLIGANEVPKNDSEAARNAVGDKSGVVQMKLDFYKKEGELMWVDYWVKASKLEGEMPPTKTHIHPGRKGENNPVLLDLPCKYKQTSASEWLCEGAMWEDKWLSKSEKAIFTKIGKHPNTFYGNIHTKKYPDGAVRGQFSRK